MNTTIKKVMTMIAGTIILCMVSVTFAQQPQQEQQPRPQRTPPTPLTERLLKAYLDLPDAQRKAENKRFLEMYEGLRVADLRDGMDWFGYMHYGSMDPAVRPLWPAITLGIARTVRYLPYVGPNPLERGQDYNRWQGMFYNQIATYPWLPQIEDGDFVAIDVSGCNVGLLGSENTIRAHMSGCRGFVLNGSGIRDTDETIHQKMPIWSHYVSQTMVQGRIQFESTQAPIAIGGVTIFPGDIIVGDNDGILVIPRAIAEEVAKQGHRMLQDDIRGRRRLFEQAGWELDETVTPADPKVLLALYTKLGWEDMVTWITRRFISPPQR